MVITRIDRLREKLHAAIRTGCEEEILKASKELDVEIVNYLRTGLENHRWETAAKTASQTVRDKERKEL